MSTPIPDSVNGALSKLKSFDLGSGGITFVNPDELQEAQRGYEDLPRGLIVIGHDSALGDPIGLDTRNPSLPAWTDMHGQGEWNPVQIADSLQGLIDAIAIMTRLSAGRENPVALESNPLPSQQRDAALTAIRKGNPQSDMDFWATMLEGSD